MNGAVLKLVVDNTQHNSQKADTFLLKQQALQPIKPTPSF